MSAGVHSQPARDFSDVAIWRGSLAAIVAGYLIAVVAPAIWASLDVESFDLQRAWFLITYRLHDALDPAALLAGFCTMGVMVVIGYFVMAAYKGDHTTYVAALIMGARTAAVGFAILLLLATLVSGGAILTTHIGGVFDPLAAIAQIVGLGAFVLIAGAITGLAARLAAGAPTVELAQEAG